jgi:magnesium/cobalt transport protein CorA
MKIISYLFDADGSENEVVLDEIVANELNDKQLLWVNVLEREQKTIEYVTESLLLKKVPIKGILRVYERPKIFKFQDYYHFFIISVETIEGGELRFIPIDFLVGKTFVLTVHDGDVKYLQDFVKRERGETQIGDLDAESFVATMLDLHIASYFRVLEKLEHAVDKMDEKILERDLKDEEFLKEMVALRKNVSRLRRWFLPHRDVFYALSRPDFKQAADEDSVENFQLLNQHFESAVDAIESARDTVLSLFDLYATKSAHGINHTMRQLTFITLTVGALGVIAGIFGMNFEVEYFKLAETGFWMTVGGMIFLAIGLATTAIIRRWI